jgi:hypothetical protein
MFKYDPQTKDTLPYYDRYPVVILVGKPQGIDGFNAINLHYLPVALRIRFLDLLYSELTDKTVDKNTKFSTYWTRLNRGTKKKFLPPMIKTYITDNIIGRIAQVYPNEWEIAAFLPFQRFFKKNQNIVWRDSFKKVYRR